MHERNSLDVNTFGSFFSKSRGFPYHILKCSGFDEGSTEFSSNVRIVGGAMRGIESSNGRSSP